MSAPVYHVTIEVRRQERRPDGTLDPRRTLVRQLTVHEAGVKVEEAMTSEARTVSVLIVGKVPGGDLDAVPVGLPS